MHRRWISLLNRQSKSPDEIIELEWGRIILAIPKDEPNTFYSTFLVDSYRKLRLRKGYTVLDIGAHVGDYSILAGYGVGSKGHVIAIEPNPRLFGLLKRNIERNNMPNIIAINTAISNFRGFHDMVDEGQGSHFTTASLTNGYVSSVTTIDSLLSDMGIRCVDAIKMDIEGEELNALSSQHSLETCKEVAVEVHNDDLARAVAGRLRTYGLSVETFSIIGALSNTLRNALIHFPSLAVSELRSGGIATKTTIRSLFNNEYMGPSTSILYGHRY